MEVLTKASKENIEGIDLIDEIETINKLTEYLKKEQKVKRDPQILGFLQSPENNNQMIISKLDNHSFPNRKEVKDKPVLKTRFELNPDYTVKTIEDLK